MCTAFEIGAFLVSCKVDGLFNFYFIFFDFFHYYSTPLVAMNGANRSLVTDEPVEV
jgi:hypothetical protein